MRNWTTIILAAGQGTRMRSALPKVLHQVLGSPLISFPVRLADKIGCKQIVTVTGHGRDAVEAAVSRIDTQSKVSFAVQREQRGTGHAVMCGLEAVADTEGTVLILSGDVPMLNETAVESLARAFDISQKVAMLTFVPEDPTGYGRILRENGRPIGIREHRDCTDAEREIREVNAGIYLVDLSFLRNAVATLKSDNDQQELYLTDIAAQAAASGGLEAVQVDPRLVAGINDRSELAEMERVMSRERNREIMRSGVTMHRPDSIRIEWDVSVGRDTEIFPDVHLSGNTVVGEGCTIGQGAVLRNCTLADRVTVKPYTVGDDAALSSGCEVGPMARLRPGAVIGEDARIGNWVEVKNTEVGKGAKANHLAYLGDGVVGEGSNLGAGTIFCNYDGFLKHKTVLGKGVFIGSDSQLVAPVTLGDGAYVASGSTITRDVPADDLALSRTPQVNKAGRAGMLKKRLKAAKERRLEKEGKK